MIESSTPLVGELGFIPGSRTAVSWVGWDLKAESSSTPIDTFTCTNTPTEIEEKSKKGEPAEAVTVSLEGSVVGRVTKTNKMLSVFEPPYKQSNGIQVPTAFTGGPEDVLKQMTTPTLPPGPPSTEQVGLASGRGSEMENKEALEIKSR